MVPDHGFEDFSQERWIRSDAVPETRLDAIGSDEEHVLDLTGVSFQRRERELSPEAVGENGKGIDLLLVQKGADDLVPGFLFQWALAVVPFTLTMEKKVDDVKSVLRRQRPKQWNIEGVILPESMKNQERMFSVTSFDIMKHVLLIMDKILLDHGSYFTRQRQNQYSVVGIQ